MVILFSPAPVNNFFHISDTKPEPFEEPTVADIACEWSLRDLGWEIEKNGFQWVQIGSKEMTKVTQDWKPGWDWT